MGSDWGAWGEFGGVGADADGGIGDSDDGSLGDWTDGFVPDLDVPVPDSGDAFGDWAMAAAGEGGPQFDGQTESEMDALWDILESESAELVGDDALGDPIAPAEVYEDLFTAPETGGDSGDTVCSEELLALYGALFAADGQVKTIFENEKKVWDDWGDGDGHVVDDIGREGAPPAGACCGTSRHRIDYPGAEDLENTPGLTDDLEQDSSVPDADALLDRIIDRLQSLPRPEAKRLVEDAWRSGLISRATATWLIRTYL